jgi:hypothetical protein
MSMQLQVTTAAQPPSDTAAAATAAASKWLLYWAHNWSRLCAVTQAILHMSMQLANVFLL